jgi:hypothetical protein
MPAERARDGDEPVADDAVAGRATRRGDGEAPDAVGKRDRTAAVAVACEAVAAVPVLVDEVAPSAGR